MDAAMQGEELNRCMDGLPKVSRFWNYCPNGLSVEGRVHNDGDTGAQYRFGDIFDRPRIPLPGVEPICLSISWR
jgi:hypothetical protein